MKRRDLAKRVPGDSVHLSVHQQTDRSGWLRKFCGRGIFRELWRNRYVSLRGEQLLLSDKEVKDDRRFQEVFSLCEYERSEELRKTNRRSKKNHSRFTLLKEPGSVVPNLVFLAVSPEEKELWVNAINSAIVRAKNHVLDEVMVEEDSVLVHPTRDRVRIPQSRRLPTRGHLLAVASSSSTGMLTLVAEEDNDLGEDGKQEASWEDRFRVDLEEVGRGGGGGGVWGGYYGDVGVIGRRRAGTDVSKLRVTSCGKEVKVKTSSLPRGSERSWGPKHPAGSPHLHRTQHLHQGQGQPRTPQPGKRVSVQGRSRCSSMDGVLSCRPVLLRSAQRRGPTEELAGGQQSEGQPAGQLHNLIAQKMQRAQELLEEMRLQELHKAERGRGGERPYPRGVDSPRLHHLRGSDSSHSRSPGSPRSRSSESPRLRGKDSPRTRGRESPRSRAKKNRSKGNESQKSTESPRVLRVTTASPRSACAKSAAPPGGPEHHMDSSPPPDRLDGGSPKVSESSEPCRKAAASPCGSSDSESPPLPQRSFIQESRSRRNFPSLSKSFDLPHPGSPASPLAKTSLKDLLRQRSFDSSAPRSTPPPPSSSSSRPCQLSEEESEVERRRAEAEHLLEEAVMSWREAQEVLQEVRDLQSRTLRRQRRQTYDKTVPSSSPTTPPSTETDGAVPMATAGGAEGEEEEEEEEDPSVLLTSPEDDQSEMA